MCLPKELLKFDGKGFILVLIGIVVGVLIVTTARAQSTDIIRACIAQPNGNSQSKNVAGNANAGSVRIVQSQSDCRSDETYITWNIQGPQGLPGPSGAPGNSGEIGVGEFLSNDFSGVSLYSGSINPLQYRNFASANFTNANLIMVDFSYSDLTSANFTNAYLTAVHFVFSKAEGANFSGTNLEGAYLISGNFIGANFTGAYMHGNSINNAIFSNANFTNADLLNSVESPADISGAVWSNTTCPDATNSNNNGGTCEGHFIVSP